jgi:SynChlorMet cassette protein ScmD
MNRSNQKGAVVNPLIILREEFDDQSLLFDPETGHTYAINPIGVLVWKHLDGHHNLADITNIICKYYETTFSDVITHIEDFVETAVNLGLAYYDVE